MQRPQLNIFGGCTLDVSESEPDARGIRTVDLTQDPTLRPDDLALLALLAIRQSCSRLECIRCLWGEFGALTERAEHGESLHPEQQARLQKANDDLTRCVSRLRKAIEKEIRKNVIHADRRRNFAGRLEFARRYLEIDYHRVREDLTKKRSTRLGQALTRVRGDLLAGYGHPALTPLRKEVASELSEWLSIPVLLKLKCTRAERAAIAQELLRTGVSPTYNSISARLAQPGQSNGRQVLTIDDDGERLAQYAVPAISPSALTLVARDTFGELLKSWLTDEDTVVPLGPATVYADMSSQWEAIDAIPFKVDVLVSEPVPQHIEIGGATYLSVGLGTDQIRALRAAAESSPRSYLAVAVPRQSGLSREETYDAAPAVRFSWWLMCAQYYFKASMGEAERDRLLFPIQNVWNLSMCALLWASRWVERFYAPLELPEVTSHPILAKQIGTVFTAKPDHRRALEIGWDHLVKDLPGAREDLDEDVFRKISVSLGLGSALQLICGQLQELGKQTQIRTYTPEALFGTISMWLFSRSYHQFMQLSGDRGVGSELDINQRLMPIKGDDPINSSRLHRAALWNVILLYRMCGVDVRVVPEPENPNSDRAYYGEGIGYWQWMAFDSAGAEWLIDQTTREVQEGYREFFLKKEGESVFDGRTSEAAFASGSALGPEALTLDVRKPQWLFPPENGFIEHPWLWNGNYGAAARLRQARQGGL